MVEPEERRVGVFLNGQLVDLIAEKIGTSVEKFALLATDNTDIIGDLAYIGEELSLIEKTKRVPDILYGKEDNPFIDESLQLTNIEVNTRLKEANKKWKHKTPVLSQEIDNATSPEIGQLFIKDSPSSLLAQEVFSTFFNTTSEYEFHFSYWLPSEPDYPNKDILVRPNPSVYEHSYFTSNCSLFYGEGIIRPEVNNYPFYNGTYIEEINYHSLPLLYFASDTGLMYATFSEMAVMVTGNEVINAMFMTNKSIEVERIQSPPLDELPLKLPLVLYAAHFTYWPTHSTSPNLWGEQDYFILKIPAITITMDVTII